MKLTQSGWNGRVFFHKELRDSDVTGIACRWKGWVDGRIALHCDGNKSAALSQSGPAARGVLKK